MIHMLAEEDHINSICKILLNKVIFYAQLFSTGIEVEILMPCLSLICTTFLTLAWETRPD